MLTLVFALLLADPASKADVPLGDVPPAVLAAAQAARPDLSFREAEQEVRAGRVYFDLGGIDQAGAPWELDIMQDGDGWTVVEIQRDIREEALPPSVAAIVSGWRPSFASVRIIESTQADGRIVYEFFDAEGRKREILLADGQATILEQEWVH